MARNCKLRCAAQTQHRVGKQEFTRWGEYPELKSRNLITSTNSSRRKGLAAHQFREPAFRISGREKQSYSRLAAGLITVALGGGVLASNFLGLERPFSHVENDATALFLPNFEQARRVDIASPVEVHKYGPRREIDQPSHVPVSSSVHHRLNVEKPVAVPVPAYLSDSTSNHHSSDAEPALAPKGELAHEYWRAMMGASHEIQRYQLYLTTHPTGAVGGIAADRIGELTLAAEKATSTNHRKQVAKAKSTAKRTKLATVQTAVTLPVKEVATTPCGDHDSFKCRKSVPTVAPDCTSSSPEGVCIRKNYRTSTVIKR